MKKRLGYVVVFCTLAAIIGYSGYTLHKKRKPVRVYVDMIADLFHYGHVSFLQQAKQLGDELIVGLISDEVARDYKRLPYLTLEERCKSVASCPFVDEVIPGSPLYLTEEFIKEHDIDLVMHGDDYSSEQEKAYYTIPIKMGIYKTIPYTKGISTSNIIQRIRSRAA